MNKFLVTAACALCLLLVACGGKSDLEEARQVFDQYCEASILGDTETLVKLSSKIFREQYAQTPPITDEAVLAMGKAFSSKSQYEVLSMEQTADDKITLKAKVMVPDVRQVLQKLEETANPEEMNGLDKAQVQSLLARKMINILQTEAIEQVSVDMPVEMVKEDGQWKVHFPVNMSSVM